jgi:hypothetical protein
MTWNCFSEYKKGINGRKEGTEGLAPTLGGGITIHQVPLVPFATPRVTTCHNTFGFHSFEISNLKSCPSSPTQDCAAAFPKLGV